MSVFFYAFLSVIAVSLVSFVGALFITLKDETLKKYIHLFISLAVGALLGDAFIHLIPETFEKVPSKILASVLLISGILIFFIIEKFMHWHHHGEDKDNEQIHPVGKLLLLTDGFHNLIDGVIIGVSFLVSLPVGLATTLAVILHEIPQEIGDFAVLIHSGYKKWKALLFNFISALAAVVGLIIVMIFGKSAENYMVWFLPIAAGGFIYIAVADLIPELHKTRQLKNSVIQLITVIFGILIMLALVLLE